MSNWLRENVMQSKALALLMWTTLSSPLCAQQLAVQQPIVGTTTVSTAVAVPDRGRMFLGGVTSAQSGRSRFGFGQPGSSLGLSRSSRGMAVGVTIIDLHEMDDEILNSIPAQPVASSQFSRHAAAIRGAQIVSRPEPVRESEATLDRAAKFEQLAHKAESENRPAVAKLHWQMAAKYGSAMARERQVARSR